MHRNNTARLLLKAAALVLTAAVLSVVIVLGKVSPTTVGTFAALLVLGWLVAAGVDRWVSRKREDSPWISVPLTTGPESALAGAGAGTGMAGGAELDSPQEATSEQGAALSDDRPDAPSGDVETGPAPLVPADDEAIAAHVPVSTPSIEPRDVVASLAAQGRSLGHVISAGLWLEDPATATLRLVAGDGTIPPGDTPLDLDNGPVLDSLEAGTDTWFEAADMTDSVGRHRIWRFIQPIDITDARGAAILDLVPAEPISLGAIRHSTAHLHFALAAALGLHVARMEASVARELAETARVLARCPEADDVVACVLERAMKMASAETGSVMLLDEAGVLTIREARGLPADIVASTSVAPGEGIAGWVFSSNKPLLVEDLPGDPGRSRRRGVRSAVSVPIGDEQDAIGVLNVGSRAFPAHFTRAHLDAMEVLGRQACVAYRNARAVRSTRELYLSTLKALAVAMETKDPYSRGCTNRVLDHVVALGRALDLTDEEMTGLEVAALFHDIGMASAGSSVISADRPLTTVEHALVKMHPAVAADVLNQTPALAEVAPIVLHHHERFDGHGYVGGLVGEAIPIGARVLAVVDAFVSMTSSRAYRRALSLEEALRELRENAGTQFDPRVVDAYVEILEERGRRAVERAD